MKSKHIILAGDSIFDNGSYVPGEPDVPQQLRNALPENDKVTLLALDGDITTGVKNQLERLPEDATHLFISVGGNDALHKLHTFEYSTDTIGKAFLQFNRFKVSFENEYKAMLKTALSYGISTTICTIYKPCFNKRELTRVEGFLGSSSKDDSLQKTSETALPIFNDVIFQEAFKSGIPLMDLRLIFSEHSDYANPIEPSSQGGQKMVDRIKAIITEHDFTSNRTVVYS